MQPVQQDRLKKLIESSPILNDAEREEWLNMLPVMNDKQSLELESILRTGVPVEKAALPVKPIEPVTLKPPVPGAIPHNLPVMETGTSDHTRMPSLSHISNLPSGLMSDSGGRPEPQPPVHPLVPVAKPQPPVESLKAKSPAPALIPKPEMHLTSTPVHAGAIHTKTTPSVSVPLIARQMPPVKPLAPKSPVDSVGVKSVAPAPAAPSQSKVRVQLETIADAGKMSLETMRAMKNDDLLLRLQQLSTLEGYFNVLSYIEDSPLFRTYIETGKRMLTEPSNTESDNKREGTLQPATMTKQEFEIFADILRKIQINQ